MNPQFAAKLVKAGENGIKPAASVEEAGVKEAGVDEKAVAEEAVAESLGAPGAVEANAFETISDTFSATIDDVKMALDSWARGLLSDEALVIAVKKFLSRPISMLLNYVAPVDDPEKIATKILPLFIAQLCSTDQQKTSLLEQALDELIMTEINSVKKQHVADLKSLRDALRLSFRTMQGDMDRFQQKEKEGIDIFKTFDHRLSLLKSAEGAGVAVLEMAPAMMDTHAEHLAEVQAEHDDRLAAEKTKRKAAEAALRDERKKEAAAKRAKALQLMQEADEVDQDDEEA